MSYFQINSTGGGGGGSGTVNPGLTGQIAFYPANSNVVSGETNLPIANLNGGTNASSKSFWRGDGTWVNVPYDIGGFVAGLTFTSEKIFQYVFNEGVSFPLNFTGSDGFAGTPSTGTATYVINKNGSQVGSIIFLGASSTALFTTTAGAFTVVAGDYLNVIGPATPDATLADWSFTFQGYLT